MQEVNSMMTSINVTKTPAIWKKLNIPKGTYRMVDYGAGRPETRQLIIRFLTHEWGVNDLLTYLPYDPYWGDTSMNDFALHHLCELQDVDLCVCANVINVVDVGTIRLIIKDVCKAKNWIFQVYEGNKSGEGKITKPGCFQHNKRTRDYAGIFDEVFKEIGYKGQYFIKGNFITNNLNLLK